MKILGPCFANILDGEDTHSEIQRLVDDDQVQDSEVKIKLFHLFQNMDKQILSKLLEEISAWVLFFLRFYLLSSSHAVRFPIIHHISSLPWHVVVSDWNRQHVYRSNHGQTRWIEYLFCFVFLHFHYRQVRLDPTAVKNDMELLKRFCSEGEKRVLKSVRYTSGLNYLHISLGCKELLLTLMQCTGKQREEKKACVLLQQKTWKSLYLSVSSH